jgi:hypothetical protein
VSWTPTERAKLEPELDAPRPTDEIVSALPLDPSASVGRAQTPARRQTQAGTVAFTASGLASGAPPFPPLRRLTPRRQCTAIPRNFTAFITEGSEVLQQLPVSRS